jgi:hypothetical protein
MIKMYYLLYEDLGDYFYNAIANGILILDEEKAEFCKIYFENLDAAYKGTRNRASFVLEISISLGSHNPRKQTNPEDLEMMEDLGYLAECFQYIFKNKQPRLDIDKIKKGKELIKKAKLIFG